MEEDTVSRLGTDRRVQYTDQFDFTDLKIDLEKEITKYGSIYRKLYRPFHDPSFKTKSNPKYSRLLQRFRLIIERIKYISRVINDPDEDYTVKLDLRREYLDDIQGKISALYASICQYPEGGPICDQIETSRYINTNISRNKRIHNTQKLATTRRAAEFDRLRKKYHEDSAMRPDEVPTTYDAAVQERRFFEGKGGNKSRKYRKQSKKSSRKSRKSSKSKKSNTRKQ